MFRAANWVSRSGLYRVEIAFSTGSAQQVTPRPPVQTWAELRNDPTDIFKEDQ